VGLVDSHFWPSASVSLNAHEWAVIGMAERKDRSRLAVRSAHRTARSREDDGVFSGAKQQLCMQNAIDERRGRFWRIERTASALSSTGWRARSGAGMVAPRQEMCG
jgi:hypothetical protein